MLAWYVGGPAFYHLKYPKKNKLTDKKVDIYGIIMI